MKNTYIQNPLRSARVFVLAGLALGTASVAHAQIIYDTFTGSGTGTADGTLLSDHTPDTNLPGGTYFEAGQGYGGNPTYNPDGFPIIVNDEAALYTNASGYISIASNSAASYTKPTEFTISADIVVGNVDEDAGDVFARGIGLGFVSSDDTSFGNTEGDFTGLVLEVDGTVELEVDGSGYYTTLEGAQAYNAADFGNAAFSTSTAYTLTYTVNTATGGISGATLSDADGSESYDFTTTAFSDTATTDAGFIVSAANGGGNGTLDNFSVTAVPEPSTWAMMVAGLLLVMGWRFRRNA